ncbi:MAG: hypothetical protein J6T51_06935 [Kiritimatiellae bacterium]|nr:hypothetical protein [Kiritimatiellia bacterium]
MKKLLSIAVCASAVAAFGSNVEVTLGEVGVTAITSSLTNIVVAVSYKDLATDDGNISISNVIKTANLAVGDSIRVFKANGSYDAYTLIADASGNLNWAANLNWGVGATSSESAAEAPDSTTLTAGTGFWLVRGPNWNGLETTFYIYGKPTTSVTTRVAKDTATLVGNPTQRNLSPTFSSKVVGDRVFIPDPTKTGGQKFYTYSKDGTWKASKSDFSVVPPVIPAGTGFWYVPKAESTVSWSDS